MPDPAISVIVPAFQAEATIAEALDSVFAQSLPPDEVIVVDDGSTDATAAIVRERFPQAVLVSQPNRGGAAATNAGVARATGGLLAFQDSDDVWAPEKLSRQSAALRADPALDGIGGHAKSFLCPRATPEEAARLRVPETPQPSLIFTAFLVRAAAFARVGPLSEDLSVGFTIDWTHRAERAGLRFAILPDVVVMRRVRAGSLTARSQERDRSFLEMARRAIARPRTKDAAE